jgi:hypothetical protein
VSDSQPPSNPAYSGFLDPNAGAGDFNATAFLVSQLIGKVGTMMPVQVVGTTSSGLVAAPGTVTVVPQINQIDGFGNPTPRAKIYGLPIWRLQGGNSAIILDPVVGDLGMAFVAMRDISKFKATKKQSNPGSFRRYDLADSIYVGSILGAAPTQYVQFLPGGGINIVSTGNVAVTASGNATVTAQKVDLLSSNVNLGAEGGKAVARVGDTVSGGVITTGSSTVKCA